MQRTVLITGASHGIGRAVAEQLLANGHRLCLGLRDPARLKGTPLESECVLPVPMTPANPSRLRLWWMPPSAGLVVQTR